MGNYRQHLGFASFLGIGLAGLSQVLAGVHWLYGVVGAILTTLGGLLPDLDSPSGVGMRGFSGLLGLFTAMVFWRKLGTIEPPPAFEFHLVTVVLAYLTVRHGARRLISWLSVHRGMGHSLPSCAVWGAVAYLFYPSEDPMLRAFMAIALMLGFFSHLLLDEFCSVDLKGARVNKAFGTAIKLWSSSPWSTLATYALLGYLVKLVIDDWPDGPNPYRPPIPPRIPEGFDRIGAYLATTWKSLRGG